MTITATPAPSCEEVRRWCAKHIGTDPVSLDALGLVEEVGEASRAVVKRALGIRGTRDEWTAALRVELGDVALAALRIAGRLGWDAAAADVADPHEHRQEWRTAPRLARLARHAGAFAEQLAGAAFDPEHPGAAARDLRAVLSLAACIAHGEGWNLPEITAQRWATVTTRDPRAPRRVAA